MNQLDTYFSSMPSLSAIVMHILVTIAILVIGWWFSGVCGSFTKKCVDRSSKIDRTILPVVQSIVVWAVRVVVILAVLARLGVQTASLVAILGASALAIGLALQGTLQNFAAGIMLLVLRPIRSGEFVSIEGKGMGTVDEIGVFMTRFIQVDGIQLLLPNSLVWGSPIVNYSRNKTRRLDMMLGVRYGDDIDAAIKVLKDLVNEHDKVLKDPAPEVMVMEYRDSTIMINIRAWIDVDDFWETRFQLYQEAPAVLAKAGLSDPVPVREIKNLS